MLSRALLLLCFLAPACGSPDDSPPPVRVEYPEGGPPLNEHFSFVVDLQGQAGVLVDVDADMPAHGHGINTDPEFEQLEDGRYRVDGMLLHMPGAWELYFDVKDGDSEPRRIVVPLELEHK